MAHSWTKCFKVVDSSTKCKLVFPDSLLCMCSGLCPTYLNNNIEKIIVTFNKIYLFIYLFIYYFFVYWCGTTLSVLLYEEPLRFSSSLLLSEEYEPGTYLTAGRLTFLWATPHTYDLRHNPVIYATPLWATLRSCELCHTSISYATPLKATQLLSELCHNPLSYRTPLWAKPCPCEVRHTPVSYATPLWITSHPSGYATPLRATPHPCELRPTTMSYEELSELRNSFLSNATPL
jgi:hypothetical protein